MRTQGRRFFWVGNYAQADAPTLTAYHNGLQSQFGFVPVGAPVYRTWGSNAVGVAIYEQGAVLVVALPGTINISAWLRVVPDVTALKAFTRSTFGLSGSGTRALEEGEDAVNVE